MTWADAAAAAYHVFVGAALGAFYFLLLREGVRLLAGGGGVLRAAPLHLARIGVAGATFWMAAQDGAPALLLTLAGFTAARAVVLRLSRERG